MDEVEDEVEYLRDQDSAHPRYYVPFDDLTENEGGSDHLDRRSFSPDERRHNKIKLDSILLKGSILLTRSPKSDYVDDAVFFISKAYFYEREWYQAQQKAEELIKEFPESEWQPDAHLFAAMAMMQQGDYETAETMLSRAIDVAWKFQREDVLTEAFRLNADIQLAKGDIEQAVKPYERAILLSEDDEEKARWQYGIGIMYFRHGNFEQALEEFDKVDQYDPDDITEFQTGLQSAVAMRAMGQYDEAGAKLEALAEDGDFEDWAGMVQIEQLNLATDKSGNASLPDDAAKQIDSLNNGQNYAAYGFYERAIRAFRKGDYKTAYQNFVKVQSSKAPFQKRAQRYAVRIGYYNDQHKIAGEATRIRVIPFPDSLGLIAARAYYNIARVFTRFEVEDSIKYYYELSSKYAPEGSVEGARAMYARSALARDEGRGLEADSLLDVIVQSYSTTTYAVEARQALGYTEDVRIDPAKDLYLSGRSFMNIGNDELALPRFQMLISEHPQSPYAPQAYYAIGLIYEERAVNLDSAFKYYSLLLEKYPESEQARAVQPIVDAVLAERVPGEGTGGGTEREGDLIPLDQNPNREMPMDYDGTGRVRPETLVPQGPKDAAPPGEGTTAVPNRQGGIQQQPRQDTRQAPPSGRETTEAPEQQPVTTPNPAVDTTPDTSQVETSPVVEEPSDDPMENRGRRFAPKKEEKP